MAAGLDSSLEEQETKQKHRLLTGRIPVENNMITGQ